MQNPNTPEFHDFKKPIEVTSVALANKLLAMIVKNKKWMFYDDTTMTEKKRHDYAVKQIDFNIEFMKLLAQSDIPADYATYPIEKILAVLQPMGKMTAARIKEYEDEIMARTVGVRSPVNNKFRQEMSTVKDLLTTLDTVREKTGGDIYDYFDKPVEAAAPADGSITSPFYEKN